MPTTTELTEKYLEEHPVMKNCLKQGIVNYSKLSRKIAKDLNIEKQKSLDAILIACRRYAEKLKSGSKYEEKVINLMKKSELEIKTKIIVCIIDKRIYLDHLSEIEKKVRALADVFYVIEGSKVFTIITAEKYSEELNKLFKRNMVKTSNNLAMLILKSPENLENIPGVIAYLSSLFAERGINIVEIVSCWTDTIIIIEEKDIQVALNFLRF